MNYGPLLFLGVFLTLASSWCGLVLIPQLQLWKSGGLEAVKLEKTGEFYPPMRSGLAEHGREVYRANGCIYCHSQQVRPKGFGGDFLRNWGQRRSVGRDYLRDKPVMLGTMRTGPDLTNISLRQPSASWHMLHLYNPQITSPGSIMPPFRFLFETRKIRRMRSPDALDLKPPFAPPPGYEVVPKPEAQLLVDYLLSLRAVTPLPETE
ncbi:MAG: cbb3-type cytochrome c oxidase subunit II [Candidatus Omnitrophica bacterium]|nr:cbb3-type cytochrome c oxidase subunit II [Candidatus Omnitrophota bacterium]